MSIYVVPSFINLVIKSWLFWHGRQSLLLNNRLLGLLLLSFFLLNLAELISFCLMDHPQYLEMTGRGYYVTAVFFVTMMLVYADQLSYRKIHWIISLVVALNMSILVIFTDNLIAGVESLGYIITRIPGHYYWVMQLYVLLCVTGALILLFMGSRYLEDLQQRKICNLMCCAFLPIVVTIIYVVTMMALGARLNAAIYVTSSITVFLLIVVYAEVNYKFLNFLTTGPAFGSSILTFLYRVMINILKGRSVDIRSLFKELEGIFITKAYELCDGKRQDAADLLGIPQSTFNEKLRKLK